MATVVGSRSEMFRNRTGSLSELDTCADGVDDYLSGTWRFPYQNYTSWSSEHVDTSEEKLFKSLPIHEDASGTLTVDQCLSIRHVLSIIQRRLKSGRATKEQLRNLPWVLFSSVMDNNEDRRLNQLGLGQNGSHSHTTEISRSRLLGALFDANVEQLLQSQNTFSQLSKTKRRHCISESDLPGSLENDALRSVESSEVKSAFSADFSSSIPFRATLPTRHVGRENLADSKLFEDSNGTTDSLQITKSVGNSIDLPCSTTTNEDCAIALREHQDLPTSPSASNEPATVPTTENQSNAKPTFLCGSPIRKASTDVESFIEPIVTNCSQAVPRTDSSTTFGSALSMSSSMPKLPKSVSFADEVGQSLTEVFLIECSGTHESQDDEDDQYDRQTWPGIRKAKFQSASFCDRFTRSRLKQTYDFGANGPGLSKIHTNSSSSKPASSICIAPSSRYVWCVRFPQPASQYFQFRQRIENGSVSLENVTLTQPSEQSTTQLPALSGTIKVKNISFEKQVWLRLTTDNWQSYTDHMALYDPQLSGAQPNSPSRFDTFAFQIQVAPQFETNEPCDRIEFAIRYVAGLDGSCGQHWDNNNGKNYIIERKAVHHTTWSNEQLPVTTTSTVSSSQFFDSFTDYGSTPTSHFNPYTPDYRPNFSGITQFTNYRAWNHFAGESTYY